ncbi:MAG: ATP-binding protein [Hyphomicrobiaceae bacterium]
MLSFHIAATRTTVFRLIAIHVAIVPIATAAVVGVLYVRTSALLTRQVLQTIVAEAEGLEDFARIGGLKSLADVLAERVRTGNRSLYLLADAQGRTLAGNLNRWPPELDRAPGGTLFHYTAGEPDAPHRLAAGVVVGVAGGARLLVARDIEEQRRFAAQVLQLFLIGSGLLAAAGLAGGVLASRALLRRVEAITCTSRTIMTGDLSRRIALAGSDDELDRLARNLNLMLDRIEQLLDGMREVSDNIAHDLRTPLNRMRNRAESYLRESRDEAGYREGLERTIEDADELIRTFNALLLIARLEAGAIEEHLEDFDLAGLLTDAAELYDPAAEQAGRMLAVSVCGPVMVRANRQLLSQAVANLIDNAIKYGAPLGDGNPEDIRISLTTGSDGIAIVVADRGAGIPASERERVLKRFVRLEYSRTRPGTGLGLSLVAAVARLHGGSVRFEDRAPGLAVIVELPRNRGAIIRRQ